MLTSCEMVEPEAPNLEIDIPDDEFDEEFRGPMRVSRKGEWSHLDDTMFGIIELGCKSP